MSLIMAAFFSSQMFIMLAWGITDPMPPHQLTMIAPEIKHGNAKPSGKNI
jgi:hypothetical protein